MWHEEETMPAPTDTMLIGAVLHEGGKASLLLGEVWKGQTGWWWQDCRERLRQAPTHWCPMPEPPICIERISRHPG